MTPPFVRSVSLALCLSLAGCAGSGGEAAPAPASGHTMPSGDDDTCAVYRTEIDGQAAFAAVAYGRYGIVLPGQPEAWHSECPSQTGSYVYFGEVDVEGGALSVSLEDVGAPELTPFDERGYFAIFSQLMLARRSPRVISMDDLGVEALAGGHVAWFSRSTITGDDGRPVEMVAGYAVRPLSADRVLVAHVSRHGHGVTVEVRTLLARMLTLFGTHEELFGEGDGDDATSP